MIRVCALRFDRTVETTWCGVRVASALRWLKRCGFRPNGPLRIRARGRSWIEDVDHPATITALSTVRVSVQVEAVLAPSIGATS